MKVKKVNGQNVLTTENQVECYRIEYRNYDFGEGYDFNVEEVKKSVEENGVVFTACDYHTMVIAIKKLIK